MSGAIAMDTRSFGRLRDFIERESGIVLTERKQYLLETRLAKLLKLHTCATYDDLCGLAFDGGANALKDAIIDAITTNETLWFRDGHPFAILADVILPRLAARLTAAPLAKARIWSAAASTGQEAYSIAMTIREFCAKNPGVRPSQFEIVATDISPTALEAAARGRYDAAAIARGLPDSMRDRYFTADGEEWAVRDEVKAMVRFGRFNLQHNLYTLGRFDCVFMRYVTIYFADEAKRRLLRNVADITNRPGFLVMGAVEPLNELSQSHTVHTYAGGSYYLKRES